MCSKQSHLELKHLDCLLPQQLVSLHWTASDQRWGVPPTSCWMCCDFCCSTRERTEPSHSGQVRGRAAWWPSLCGSLFASRNRFTIDGERTACVLPVKSVTGLFVTLCRQDCESRWCQTSIDRTGKRALVYHSIPCSLLLEYH